MASTQLNPYDQTVFVKDDDDKRHGDYIKMNDQGFEAPNLPPSVLPPANYPPPIAQDQSLYKTDPKYIIVDRDQVFNLGSEERLRKIDFQLENDFFWYQCWIVFCLILTTTSLASNIVGLALPGKYKEVKQSFIPSIVANVINLTGYFLGLYALKTKSIGKNQIFKGFLIFLIVMDVIMLVAVLATGSPTQNYDAVPWLTMVLILVLTGLINVILFINAKKIDDLLNERNRIQMT